MTYLIGEILIHLGAAFAAGLLLGFAIWGLGGRRRHRDGGEG